MDDIKQELTDYGKDIAAASIKGGGSLSALVAKTANDKKLPKLAADRLVGITNKQYLLATGEDTFEPAKIEEVYDHLYADKPRQKVAYMHPEYNTGSVAPSRSKCASLDLVETANEKPIDYSAVLRELSTKSVGVVKSKRASLYLESQDLHGKIFNNVCVLKTLGFTNVELRSKLASMGLEQPAGKLVSAIYDQSPKTKSAFSSRGSHNVEGYLNGIIEAARQLSEKTASFIQADAELKEAQRRQKATYDFGKILL